MKPSSVHRFGTECSRSIAACSIRICNSVRGRWSWIDGECRMGIRDKWGERKKVMKIDKTNYESVINNKNYEDKNFQSYHY